MSEKEPFDIYHDPNPPSWPNNKIPFNRWFLKINAFLYALQYTPFRWNDHPRFSDVKYLNIRVDTRNGNFLVTDDAGKRISPDELGLKFKPVTVTLETPDDPANNQNV